VVLNTEKIEDLPYGLVYDSFYRPWYMSVSKSVPSEDEEHVHFVCQVKSMLLGRSSMHGSSFLLPLVL